MKITRYSSLYRTRDGRISGSRTYAGLLALTAAAGLLAGCGSVDPKAVDYKSSGKPQQTGNNLALPPDVTNGAHSARASAPASGSASLSTLPAPGFTTNHVEVVLPAVSGMSIQRDGSARWLVVKNRSFDQLWPQVRKFWEAQGFLLVVDAHDRGVMETDWNETHASVDLDLVRGILSKALDNAYVTGERNKYRTRFETGPDGSEYIFISQKGMHEIVTGASNDLSKWEDRPNDPGLEAQYLTRLMDTLAQQSGAAGADAATAASDPAASAAIAANLAAMDKLAKADQAQAAEAAAHSGPVAVADHVLKLNDSYDKAWLRTGLALDRANFTVDKRDRDAGLYALRYVDPTDHSVAEQGFWAQIFHGKKEMKAAQYALNVKALTETTTQISVVDKSGTIMTTPQAEHILALLADQMK
jgi:outer membrane protein assembly factor BamC